MRNTWWHWSLTPDGHVEASYMPEFAIAPTFYRVENGVVSESLSDAGPYYATVGPLADVLVDAAVFLRCIVQGSEILERFHELAEELRRRRS